MDSASQPVLLLDVMDTLVRDPFFRKVPAFFDMPLNELVQQLAPGRWVAFEYDEIDEETFLRGFFKDGRAYDSEGLRTLVHESYRYIDGVEALLAELHGEGVPMHTLSNYPRWYEAIEARLKLSRYVEWSFVSCLTGHRKPDAEAYTHAAQTLGVAPERCIFVDDRKHNVTAAIDVGMQGIVFESAAQLRKDLEDLGALRRT